MRKQSATILVIDDDPDILTAARVVLRQHFETVHTENVPERLKVLLTQHAYDLILLDMNFRAGTHSGNEGLFWLRYILSKNQSVPVVMITAYGEINLAVQAMKEGAADFIAKPWSNDDLTRVAADAIVKKKRGAQVEGINATENTFPEIIFQSQVMQNLLKDLKRVSETDANILLQGESGTGKTLLARYVHGYSKRSPYPFVAVDLGSITTSLFESELFGYKKGAFTDAKSDRIGRMQLSHRGTLFLDEIGNLSIENQQKLLSALQSKEIIPLGSNEVVSIDIRLITASNANIRQRVIAGHFRQDLYYRINTTEFVVPPLREREEDIGLLAENFVQQFSAKYEKNISSLKQQTLRFLKRYHWPGNVRELEHAVERAVIMSEHDVLLPEDFSLQNYSPVQPDVGKVTLDELEKTTILAAITKHKGNMSKVARELGLGRTTLYRKLARYGLDKEGNG
ncbi:MAG TPA: sigma-54 dependent transcriptional regulator [Chryseosolibacter sp.]|nr:sigma-54 dependent transcriptional regulator [Chryseosolibacter sp.]